MKNKTFTLRVDLESDKGIREGLPKLLDLLKKHGVKASFYVCMGGESGLFELLKYSGKMESSGERKIKLFSLKEKIRIAFFPRDFVKRNKKILRRIIDDGHELGIHGWKHREWTRGLEKIDVRKKINDAKIKYAKIFWREAKSFAAPGFNTNEKIVKILKESGIKYISDFDGEKISNFDGIKNVPITISGENKTPIIEYLVSGGKKDSEIFEIIKEKINKEKICSFYIHDLFEARFKTQLLEEIFEYVKLKKIQIKRIIDY